MPDGVARLDDLLDGISPNKCESIWVEPYNNRVNWQAVRDAYPEDSRHRGWFTPGLRTARLGGVDLQRVYISGFVFVHATKAGCQSYSICFMSNMSSRATRRYEESQGRAAPGKNRGRRQVDKSVDQGYSVGHGRQGASRKANSRERVGARLIR